ncbi:AlbA family DNA-binding domain-containing protein [Lichenifustis flavocetrariae]|uniref:ATP-binding protein n=1 Tax=Lichenifustis flavocetrariae TaxID=2949735 RepID=A0AA41YWH8_9HYPH|nr:ATP-binding protein [Lichenifustis flavocetrariae]MCW6509876.1 ATP-binding protein [Lichenifustis flavocetrariae]
MSGKSEDLSVEYKAWMDTTQGPVRAKLAKHIAALANHGGGYLIFGVDDKSRLPQGEPGPGLDRSMFSQDAISGIVKKYLDPRIQVRLEEASHDGVLYPVIVVPSHAGRPIIAVTDGPQENNRPVGVRQGEIYVRAAGPERAQIRSADDWNALLDRCLTHRADLLGNIVRQTIARPGRPSAIAIDALLEAVEATASDFSEQTGELAPRVAASDQKNIAQAGQNFSTLAYALVGDDGELIELGNVRGLNQRASIAMGEVAYIGWASFLPLNVPERAPQLRTGRLLGRDRSYLEGMRLAASAVIGGSLDYWRIYETGIAAISQSYPEDNGGLRSGIPRRIEVGFSLLRVHSLLAHARFMGQEIPGVQQIVVRMDWRGMAGRMLTWDEQRFVTPGQVADDRFIHTVTLPWARLRDTYFDAFTAVIMPMYNLFPEAGWGTPDRWFNRGVVEREFGKFKTGGVRLFDD